MEILKQFQNKLLNRTEIVAELEANVTPSKNEIKKMISEKFKVAEDQIVIEHILGKFGSKVFDIEAKIYDDVSSLAKYETVSKKEKKKREEALKKAAEEARKAKEAEKAKQETEIEEPKSEENSA
jgi:ribosomal protein S24E